ncbi:MAG TPA: hypothetical protein VFW16_12000, partial [Streptosporangiaceae bacterium]|nr:hypothetical protein [Streptosporangiaceae bacterium]
IIGERINPTGRKKFAEELRGGDLSTVTIDAVAQVEAGADMLDINAGIPLVDEPELLKSMLTAAQRRCRPEPGDGGCLGHRAALCQQRGRDRRGPPVLRDRRADQPDRQEDLPATAAQR